jgi:hypothetical protein
VLSLAVCWLNVFALIDLAAQRLPNALPVPAYFGVAGFVVTHAVVGRGGRL